MENGANLASVIKKLMQTDLCRLYLQIFKLIWVFLQNFVFLLLLL